MTFLYVERKRALTPAGRSYVHSEFHFRCDNETCGIEFIKPRRNGKKKFHYCSMECCRHSITSGVLRQYIDQHNLETIGYSSPLGSPMHREKGKQTSLKKYGKEWYTQTSEHAERVVTTSIEKYGVKSILQLESTRQRLREVNNENYGVDYTWQSKEFRDRVLFSADANARRHVTMKQRGVYSRQASKFEMTMIDVLRAALGPDDLLTHVSIPGTRMTIDAYIKSLDMYIQFDGDYWHGLDRPLDEIAKHKTKRDVVIHQKWKCDRQLDAQFKAEGKKLIRILESQAKQPGFDLVAYITALAI